MSLTPIIMSYQISREFSYWSGWVSQRKASERTLGLVHSAKIQVILRVRSVWSESSLCAVSIANDAIAQTWLYNFVPLKPLFYVVKLGFTGVCIIFIISAQKHRLWYSLEPPRRGGSNEYPQSMFWAEIWKMSEFFIGKFSFFGRKIFNIFK